MLLLNSLDAIFVFGVLCCSLAVAAVCGSCTALYLKRGNLAFAWTVVRLFRALSVSDVSTFVSRPCNRFDLRACCEQSSLESRNVKKLLLGCGTICFLGFCCLCVIAIVIGPIEHFSDKGIRKAQEEARKAKVAHPQAAPALAAESDKFQQVKTGRRDGDEMVCVVAAAPEFAKDNFTKFCRSLKSAASVKTFFCVSLFDEAAHVSLPDNPYSAGYGLDEAALKHIKATYVANVVNGFEETLVYDSNAWEGKPHK